eukprot:COSAG06_NODE_32606_length_503_cov_1.002475_1_plen_89_part_10
MARHRREPVPGASYADDAPSPSVEHAAPPAVGPLEGERLRQVDRVRNTRRANRFVASVRRWLPQSQFAARQARQREVVQRRAEDLRQQR